MDTSSDESFAWTDASNDTIDSVSMVSNTMNKPNSEDESVSGKTYKKKLQEELFAQSYEQKLQHKERKRKLTEVHSESEYIVSPKKKKIKREPESDIDVSTKKHKTNGHNHSESHDSYDESYLKLKVKAEQQSATSSPIKTNTSNEESFGTTKSKSNRKSKEVSEEAFEDDTLHQLVQEENENNERKTKKKKRKKRKNSTLSDDTQLQESHMEEGVAAEDGKMSPMQYAEKLDSNFTDVSQPAKRDKKAKNKKKLSKSSTGDTDDCRDEDTDRRKKQLEAPVNRSVSFDVHSESANRTQSLSERIQFENEDVAAEDGKMSPMQYAEELESNFTDVSQPDTVKRDKKAKNKKRLSKSSTGDTDDCRDEDTDSRKKQLEAPVNRSVTFDVHSESAKRTSISERIQFENEDSSDIDTSQLQSSATYQPSTKSSKLKAFLNDNSSLKPFTSKLETDSVLTVDDEIWIVRCPRDVDIVAFQNKDFTLEGKCKLKLNGQTYEGTMDDESENMSILSSERSHFIIKSLSLKGYLNLRKRIPKSHIQDEAMVNNQCNFIPLPETKCRHPLFGSNYRKAIKLPASVTERLKESGNHEQVSNSTHKKKKKSHKERASQETSGHFVSTPKAEPSPKSVKPEVESDHTVSNKKMKKKRKHSKEKQEDSEEIAPRKKKRMKHDLESVEAWESEQAIEENLFTF